jgi:tRNA1Val (adenine37-N6)-methyltransferase
VLLAGLTDLRPGDRVIDLGTGCGIILLLLACRHPQSTFVGLECQDSLVELARKNVAINSLAPQVDILPGDMRSLPPELPPGAFDVVLSNPPYRPLGAGRLNPNSEKAIARHELRGSLETVAQAAASLLRVGGRLSVIYPVWRLATLFMVLRQHKLEPKAFRMIHSRAGEDAVLAWIEARKEGGEELRGLPPLFIYAADGGYTPEVQVFLEAAPDIS